MAEKSREVVVLYMYSDPVHVSRFFTLFIAVLGHDGIEGVRLVEASQNVQPVAHSGTVFHLCDKCGHHIGLMGYTVANMLPCSTH